MNASMHTLVSCLASGQWYCTAIQPVTLCTSRRSVTLNLMAAISLLLVVIIILSYFIAAAVCPSSWSEQAGSCYQVVADYYTRSGAAVKCAQLSAHLVTIADKRENTFVHGFVENACVNRDCPDSIWLGLTHPDPSRDTRDGWTWTDNTPYVWQNWYSRFFGSDEPSQGSGCVQMWRDGRKWGDDTCDKLYVTVCERVPITDSAETPIPPSFTHVGSTHFFHATSVPMVESTTVNIRQSRDPVTLLYMRPTHTEYSSSSRSKETTAVPLTETDAVPWLHIGVGAGVFVLLGVTFLVAGLIWRRKVRAKKADVELSMEDIGSNVYLTEPETAVPDSGIVTDDYSYVQQRVPDVTQDAQRQMLASGAGDRTSSPYVPMTPGSSGIKKNSASSPLFPVVGASAPENEYDYARALSCGSLITGGEGERKLSSASGSASKLLEAEFEAEMKQGDYVSSESAPVPIDGIYSLAKQTSCGVLPSSPTTPVYENVPRIGSQEEVTYSVPRTFTDSNAPDDHTVNAANTTEVYNDHIYAEPKRA